MTDPATLLSNLQPSYLRLTAEEWHHHDLLFHFSKHLRSLFPVRSSPPFSLPERIFVSPRTQTFPVLFWMDSLLHLLSFFLSFSISFHPRMHEALWWTQCSFSSLCYVSSLPWLVLVCVKRGLVSCCRFWPNKKCFLKLWEEKLTLSRSSQPSTSFSISREWKNLGLVFARYVTISILRLRKAVCWMFW